MLKYSRYKSKGKKKAKKRRKKNTEEKKKGKVISRTPNEITVTKV